MKAYIIITGVIFALITIAHCVRMVMEPHVLTEPLYLLLTLFSTALAIWAVLLLLRPNR